MYYSEFGQDQWLEEHIFKNKRKGVFVEIGALDGIFHSNTFFFEKERDWDGICIEPNPTMFAELVKNRTCMKLGCAITSVYGTVDFLQIDGVLRGWSCVLQTIECEHAQRIVERDLKRTTISVPSFPLDKIISTDRKIDYLSIDVEGSEKDILLTFPIEKYDIDILEVEINFDDDLDKLITDKNFVFLQRLGVSNIYRNRRYLDG